ncbi:MAG: DUF3883 domain-containing protein [Planctomycetaceae bacterium]|nr:DUF3883 domain-containing protein [Planctomycetaceae bacterium]
MRAMELARAHLELDWPEVQDVSRHESFDFLCVAGKQKLHVEVKGTTGDGSVVLLTRNEVEHARTNPDTTALIVVSQIELIESHEGQVTAAGGDLKMIHPWRITESVLVPLTYACMLD